MEKALAMSMGKKYEEYISSGQDQNWDEEKPSKPELK